MPNNVVEITFRVRNDDGGQLSSLINNLGTLKSAGTAQAQENAALAQSSNVLAQAMQVLEAAQKAAASGAQSHATATKASATEATSAGNAHKALATVLQGLGTAGSAASGVMSTLGNALKTVGSVSVEGIKSFGSELGKIGGGALSGLKDIASNITGIGRESEGSTPHVSALKAALDTLKEHIGTGAAIAAGMGLFRTAMEGLGGIKDLVFGVNSSLEQSALSFKVYLGSAQQAQVFVQQLNQEASRSTFGEQQLQTAAATLLAYHTNAEQVIPILKAVENAAASTGKESVANFDTLNRVIGELAGGLPLTERQIRQLVQAGIPLDPLAKQLGITTTQLLDVGKTGIVSGAQLVAAFQDVYTHGALGDFMTEQAQTASGAWQLIKTDVQLVSARAFTPLFDLLRDGLVTVSKFVQSDSFTKWAQDINGVMQIVANAVRDAAKEVKNLFDLFQNSGIEGVLEALKTKVTGFFSSLGGDTGHTGGFNLIVTFAQGMYDAATSVLTTAANDIAQMVGDFFIGHSPPPKGPLKQIHEGGAMLIDEYRKGMVEGAGNANFTEIGKTILDSIGDSLQAGGGMFGSGLADQIKNGALSMDDLKAAGEGVDEVVQTLSEKLSDIADAQASIKDQESDIQDAYSAQIDPLQRQLDTLKQTVDYTTQRRDLELEIADNRIQQQEADDPTLKGLTSQLTTLQRAQRASRDAPTNRTDENAIASLQAKERGIAVPAGATAAQRQAASDQRKSIEDQIAAIRERDRVASDGATDAAKAQQAMIDKIKQEIDDRKATYQDQLDANKAEKDSVDLKQKGLDLQRQLAELPLQQKIDDLKRAKAERLLPLQQQSQEYDKQSRMLDSQKRQWGEVKVAITDALKPLTEAETYKNQTAAQQASLDRASATAATLKVKKPSGEDLGPGGIPGIPHQEIVSPFKALSADDAAAKGKELGEKLMDNLIGYIKDHAGALIGGAIGGALGSAVLGPIGGTIGSLLGSRIGSQLQAELGGGKVQAFFAPFISAVQAEAKKLQTIFAQSGPGDAIKTALSDALHAVEGLVQGEGPKLLTQLGAWGAEFVDFAKPYIGPMLTRLGEVAETVIDWALSVAPMVRDKLLGWAQEFIAWIEPMLPGLLTELGKIWLTGEKFIGETLLLIVKKLGEWGLAFVQWVGPQIGPLIDELGKLASKMFDWIFQQLPTLGDKLLDWGKAFIAWIAPHIPPFLLELAKLEVSLLTWIGERVPNIAEKLLLWGLEFVAFVALTIPKMILKIDEMEVALLKWIVDEASILGKKLVDEWIPEALDWIGTAVTKLPDKLKEFGDGIKTWVENFAKKDLPGIVDAFVEPFLAPFTKIGSAIQGGLGKLREAVNTVGGWIGVGDIIKGGEVPAIPFTPRATGGIVNEQLTLLGERGPELAHLPTGTHVYTAEETALLLQQKRGHEGNIFAWDGTNLGRGGFPGLGDIVDAAKSAGSKVFDTVESAVKEGASALVDRATKGLSLGLPEPFSDMGGHLLGSLIGAVKDNIGELIDKLKDAIGGNNDAVNVAMGMLSSDGLEWNNWCQRFVDDVRQALGFGRSGAASALDHINSVRGSIRPGIGPVGSAEVWDFPPDGHIDVNGPRPGQGISTGPWGIEVVDQSRFGPPTGWIPINLDTGGITRDGGLYNLHPGEAVIPLDSPRARAMAGGDTHITVNLNGPIAGGARDVAKQLAPALRDELVRIRRQNPHLQDV